MKKWGKVTFGDNAKGKIVGIGRVGKKNSTYIENILLIDGLKHNLLSVSQLCDKGNRVIFKSKECFITHMEENKVIFKGERVNNVYTIDLSSLTNQSVECFIAIKVDSCIWHRRLGHTSIELIGDLNKGDHAIGLPKVKFQKDKIYGACQMGKQVKSSFKAKIKVTTTRPFQLLHMDLFGPCRVASLGGKHYAYVIIDDYSRFTWYSFLLIRMKVWSF